MKQENKKLQTKLLGYKSFLSRKSTDAKILHDIGKTATDSIWFSAIKLSSEKDGINTVVEGHSLSESAVATYIVDAEKIAGITKATLEYTEKLSEDKAAKMTNGQLRCELFNFKAVLDFPPRHL
jgi:hypothetical protein